MYESPKTARAGARPFTLLLGMGQAQVSGGCRPLTIASPRNTAAILPSFFGSET